MRFITSFLRRRPKKSPRTEPSPTSQSDSSTTTTITLTATTTATEESGASTPNTTASACKDDTHFVALPDQYQRGVTKRGCIFYVNHVDKTTSWLHPVKLAELRNAGIVPPAAMSGPEREIFELVTKGGLADDGAGDPLLSKDEDDWYAYGTLPPWIMRERREIVGGGAVGGGSGGGVAYYWVDYRANKVLNHDPVEAYRDKWKLEQGRRQVLEADIRRLGMGNPQLAADLRRQGWTGHAEVASDREIAHWL